MKNQNTNAVSTPAPETPAESEPETKLATATENQIATFEVGKTYRVKISSDLAHHNVSERLATVTKKTKCFVFFKTANSVDERKVKLQANDKTEFTTTVAGMLFAAAADNHAEFDDEIQDAVKSHIAEQYETARKFADKLIRVERLTEEQANAVIATAYSDEGCAGARKLIDEFKAANQKNAAEFAQALQEALDDEKVAELKAEHDAINAILNRGNICEQTASRLREMRDDLSKQLGIEPETPAESEPEITPVDAAIETLDDDMKDEVRADIEPYKAEYNAAIAGIYLDDLSGGYDEDAEIIPAADLLQFIIPLALTDHSTTAYRKNPDGSFTEDKIAYERLCAIERKIFNEPEPEPEPPEKPAKENFDAEYLNANAPEGWTVTRADKKIQVDYQGKRVAEVDRITERDLLVPHAFFQQFTPLVDKSKTPEQMFLDDRYRELAELEEMREEIQHTPPIAKERLKTLDEMINQVKRDIAETEFNAADTVESFCKAGAIDENGEVWF